MAIRTASFFATYTTSVNDSGIKSHEESFNVLVGNTPTYTGIYTWDFTYLDDTFNEIITTISSAVITKIELAFKYKYNSDMVRMRVVKYSGGTPKLQTGETVLQGVTDSELALIDIDSTNKTGISVELEDTDNFYYETHLNIIDGTAITVALTRDPDLSSSSGSVEVSGQSLLSGGSDWREAGAGEPLDAPLLIITYEIAGERKPTLSMKYTTSTPGTVQTSPLNSIGSYPALNDVYSYGLIRESISSTQTNIPVDSGTSLPASTGLASVGPEVFKYSTIDSDNHKLSTVTRGIAPDASFPAGFDAYKNPEKIYYLSDINALFDTRPPTGLVQYRCVAIMNSDTVDDFSIRDAYLGIVQNAGADVQLQIGIELPKFDSRRGTSVDGINNTSSTLLVTTIVEEDGYYNNALIKFLNPTEYAVVESYAVEAGTYGEFILDRTITGLVAARSFTIMPAPAQALPNGTTSPSENSGRFTGFQSEGISISLLEHEAVMQEDDVFYVWIKRTLSPNAKASNDTGATLILRYRNS